MPISAEAVRLGSPQQAVRREDARVYPPRGVRTPRSASGLTAREYSLLAELVRGEGGALNKDIAFRLGIGEPTIKVYYSLLMRKLGLSNRTALALWAERSGQFCEASA